MATYLNFPFDEDVFEQSWEAAPDPTKTAMIDSGALVEDGLIEAQIQSEGSLSKICSSCHFLLLPLALVMPKMAFKMESSAF